MPQRPHQAVGAMRRPRLGPQLPCGGNKSGLLADHAPGRPLRGAVVALCPTPASGAAPAPSDADRLARMISLYSPEGPDDDHVPPPQQQGGINISRPDPQGGAGAPPLPPPTAGGSSPPIINLNNGGAGEDSPQGAPSPGKRRWLMHSELSRQLAPDVYNAPPRRAWMPTHAQSSKRRVETRIS